MSSPSPAQQIELAFRRAGITGLPASCYDQFAVYLALLLRWNARLNLTSIREPEQIIGRHFVESSFAAQHLPEGIESLLDYGSGAGLPGIPIAICCPELRVTLAEAHGRKASFLREAVRAVGTATEVYEGRVENMPPRLLFHAVALRAVEKMDLAVPLALQRAERFLVLLTTAPSLVGYQQLAPQLRWLEPILLPNSEHRILAIGQR